MNRLLLAVTLTLPLCVAQQPAAAPDAPSSSPARGGRAGRAGRGPANDGAPRELPSNQETGVDIDRFIGYPSTAFTKVLNGGLMTRSMLRNGDPYHPGPMGNVLEYRDECAVATLEPHFETGAMESQEIYFYYVQGGEGRVDSGPGTESYNLHAGVGVLLAPGAKQHFVNTGDKQLSMIMVTWKDNNGMTVKKPIKVVDSNTVPFGNNRAHWIHMGKQMFNANDGINTVISPIYFPPMSYGGPHAHVPGVEELWVKVGSDEGYMILGSEIRRAVGNVAFLSPPNGKTTHSSMNLNEEHPSIWLYIAHRAPQNSQSATSAAAAPAGVSR